MLHHNPHIALIAGERSGDRLGAPLIAALRAHFPQARFTGIGGELMQAAGLESFADMNRLSVMGFSEVLLHLSDIWQLKNDLLQRWQADRPDLFIGIDAPDFTLRIAAALHQHGVQTVHYVSPSLWAWKAGRIKQIKRAVDHVLCLFPFETDIYHQHHMGATWVGHPMKDRIKTQSIAQARQKLGIFNDHCPVIGLFSGSRVQEIKRLLPIFLAAAQKIKIHHHDLALIISLSDKRHEHLIKTLVNNRLSSTENVFISNADSALLMSACDVLMLKSGTITLEATLLQRPMLSAYRVHPLTAFIARRLIKIPHFSLPNILAGRAVIHEWIQENCTPEYLAHDAETLLTDPEIRARQLSALAEIAEQLPENVSQRAAAVIADLLKENK